MTDAVRPGTTDLLGTLAAFADALARADDLDATLARLLTTSVAAAGADRALIAIHDPDGAGLELAASVGMDEALVDAARASLTDPASPLVRAVESRRTTWDRAGAADTAVVHADLPLVTRRDGIDLVVGVVSYGWGGSRGRGDAERTVVEAAANLAAAAIDRWRLASLIAERSEWFERMAQSDPLTGLANERTFSRVLELELARAGRQGGEVSVALFDVDGFVATNASGGHQAGDAVLRSVAAVLNESVRLVDTVARIGGDEFVLVAPGSAGMTVARRVLEGVAALAPVGDRPISISAGIARFPTDGTTAEELLEAAAAALERAKDEGPATVHESSTQPAR